MIKPLTFFDCCCRHCGKEWTTKTAAIPAVCSKCHRKGWNDDYVEPAPVPKISLADRVKRLNVTDRLALFEHFELCCGMDRGQCICPEEIIEAPQVSPEDERQAKLAMLRGQTAAIENSEPKAVEQNDDNWIEDGKTFENGEILYWHHKARCKPVIYRRETDWTSFA